jgi:3'-phosphoadenosine 5'-phosphosulfate sulfotransferase (PAPS reductase)/FAD synthetase
MELVINFSGGKDSTAMLAWLCERYPDVPKHVVMADTGWEHKEVPGKWCSAIEWSEGIVALFGLPLHVVRNPNKTLLTMAEKRGKFPGMQQRQCTSDLKRDPVYTWIRQRWPVGGLVRPPVIVSTMGLRAQESIGRAKKKCIAQNQRLTVAEREVLDWNPILGWTEDQVLDYLCEREIPIHPVYEHLRRFSCRVCIYMSDHDLQRVRENDPEAIDLLAVLEGKIGFTMFQRGGIQALAQGPPPTSHCA